MIDLQLFQILRTLPRRELEKTIKISRVKKYASGTKILQEQEEVKELALIIQGQVSIIKNYKGRKKSLFTIGPGDFYGEVEILNGTLSLTTLVGYQEFQILYIPKEFFLRLIGLYPGFAKEIRDIYSNRAPLVLEEGLSKSGLAQVITFFNAKGGAGKSVISSNIAVMLAKMWKKKVMLLDLNLAFGDQAILLNLPADKNIYQLQKEKPPLTIEKIEQQSARHSSGLNVLLAPPRPELAEKIKPDFIESIIEILRIEYDFIIIDTHNQVTDIEIKILELSDQIMLTMTMELTFIKNTKVLIDLLQRLGISRDKIKVILNRAFKKMGLEPAKVEKSMRYAISHFIPSEGNIVIPSVNKGIPFCLSKRAEGTPIFLAMNKICSSLTGENIERGTWNMFSLLKEVFGL